MCIQPSTNTPAQCLVFIFQHVCNSSHTHRCNLQTMHGSMDTHGGDLAFNRLISDENLC